MESLIVYGSQGVNVLMLKAVHVLRFADLNMLRSNSSNYVSNVECMTVLKVLKFEFDRSELWSRGLKSIGQLFLTQDGY